MSNKIIVERFKDQTRSDLVKVITYARYLQYLYKHGGGNVSGVQFLDGLKKDAGLSKSTYEALKKLIEDPELDYTIKLVG